MKKTFSILLIVLAFSTIGACKAEALTCTNNSQCASGQSCVGGSCADSGGSNSSDSGASNSSKVSVKLNNPFRVCPSSGTGSCGLLELLQAMIDNIVLPIGGVLIVLAFIYTGFRYVMAQGNATEISKVTTMFKYTVIGAVLLLGAAAISQVVKGTLDQFQSIKQL